MKVDSIEKIHKMLKRNVDCRKNGLENKRKGLEEKYQTEWLDSVMTNNEKLNLNYDRQEYREACDLLKDFEEHQW